MAVQRADPGGEYYFSLGVLGGIFNSGSGTSALVSNAPAGRATQFGISMISNNTYLDTLLASGFATLIAAGAFYVPAIGTFVANTTPIAFFDGATTQCDLRITTSGTLQITRNGTVLATSSNALVSGSGWHYFEFEVTFGTGTSGSAQAWIDGVSWVSVASVNTANNGTTTANHVRYGWSGSGGVLGYWKDMVIIDTGTGTVTTRQGDNTVWVIYPNAAGVNQQFSNTGGASQTASVQDGITGSGTRPDGDTSYISDSVSGHVSDFAHQTLSAGTIAAVIHVSYVKSAGGVGSFEQVALSGGTTHATSPIVANTSYNYYFDVIENDPHTSSPWTVSNFNAATFGVQIP